MIKELTSKYAISRFVKVLIKSDLLTTRAMVGFSSFFFGSVLFFHYLREFHLADLFWVIISFFHSFVVLGSLYFERVNKFTFFGEAILGVVLWNYVNLSILFATVHGEKLQLSGAPMVPAVVVGLATWWILSRYPSITRKG